MLDRSTCKEMLVWDLYKIGAVKRIVIAINEDRSCLVVRNGDKEAFYKGDSFRTVTWQHYEEIKEPKMRLMTRNEMLGFITRHPHIVVKTFDVGNFYLSNTKKYILDVDCYLWANISESGEIGEWNKFEVEDTE